MPPKKKKGVNVTTQAVRPTKIKGKSVGTDNGTLDNQSKQMAVTSKNVNRDKNLPKPSTRQSKKGSRTAKDDNIKKDVPTGMRVVRVVTQEGVDQMETEVTQPDEESSEGQPSENESDISTEEGEAALLQSQPRSVNRDDEVSIMATSDKDISANESMGQPERNADNEGYASSVERYRPSKKGKRRSKTRSLTPVRRNRE